MKKKIFAMILVVILVMLYGLFGVASEMRAGGYSYLKEDGQIDFAGYFDVEGADISMSEKSIDFVLTEEHAIVNFKKVLASDGFVLEFVGVEENNLRLAEFVLTDSKNEAESVKVVYTDMSKEQTAVSLNEGGRSYLIGGSMNCVNDNHFKVGYSDDTRCINDGSELSMRVKANQDGSGFTGFSSQMVTLSISLHGESGSVFSLKELNYQKFGTKVTKDNTEPMVCVMNPIDYAVKGAVIPLEQVFAVDVLADNATVTITVRDPERNVVIAEDGTKLENVVTDKVYYIKIEKYGDYWINYEATDGENDTHMLSRQIRIMDVTPPEFTLSQRIKTSWKVGDMVEFPNINCLDNQTEPENIICWITVKYPSGVITAEKKQVKLTEQGIYEINFKAMDETGNIHTVTEKIYAEGNGNEK